MVFKISYYLYYQKLFTIAILYFIGRSNLFYFIMKNISNSVYNTNLHNYPFTDFSIYI